MILLFCVGVGWNGWVLCEFRDSFLCQILCSALQRCCMCVQCVCFTSQPLNAFCSANTVKWLLQGKWMALGWGQFSLPDLGVPHWSVRAFWFLNVGCPCRGQTVYTACTGVYPQSDSVFRCEEARLLTVFHFLWSFPVSYSRHLFSTQINLRICHLVK